ncbi:MAG: peptide deformylase [Acidobacteria bacterium]|nr:peptide deformylase [Acidobacteriota bacterium]
MIRKIVKYGDPVLETPCDPLEEFDTEELQQLVDDMFETMYDAGGVGLAAPQIGLLKRLTVIDCSCGEDPDEKLVFINPEILVTEGKQIGEEGCLSIPGFREDVKRAQKVIVRAQDTKGETFEIEGEDLLARAILHENDHLDGILFLRHISALKREMIKRKIRKLRNKGEWD